MADKLNLSNKKFKGFSLVELLIAIAIFTIVVSANFALAMNAYRSRANDRIRLEAGLVIRDTINGVYSYKNNSWDQIVSAFEDSNFGQEPRRLDLVNNKFQLNAGSWTVDKVNFSMYINKAGRSGQDIDPEAQGEDPDTIKITINASWTDLFGVEQQISENYFLSNWASARWTETTNAEFLDGTPTPVLNKTKVENDSVSSTNEVVYANNDWCNLVDTGEDATVKNIDIGSGVHTLASRRAQTNDGYTVVEPIVAAWPPPAPVVPDPPALSTITLNNTHPVVCNETSGIPILECETLVKIYESLGGSNWTNKSGWDSIDTGVIPTGQQPQPTITAGTVVSQISQSTDDAHTADSSSISTNNQNVWYRPVGQYGGLRFNNITIPQGSTINSATIYWRVANPNNDILDTTFYAEATDNSETFSTYANMVGRSLTSASVYTNQNFDGYGNRTLDVNLNQLVQEVINRPGWTSGNSLSIIGVHGSGTDVRIRSFDSGDNAPQITIDYTTTTYGEGTVGGPCVWYGVTCSGGNVTGLDLSDNALTGSLPREIGNLTSLKELVLTHSSKNSQLIGPIPPEIGLLTSLERLEISNTDFSGRIPETIGNFSALKKLVLSNINVTGKIPSSIGNLEQLGVGVGGSDKALDLSGSKFTCYIPAEITRLTNLSSSKIDIGDNYFLKSRYNQINDLVGEAPQSPPSQLEDQNVLLDCVLGPAESSVALYQSDGGADSVQRVSLSNTGFPPEVAFENIFEQDGSTGLSKAFQFSDDVVRVPYNKAYGRMSDDEPFTISLWVRADATNTTDLYRFLDFNDNASGHWYLSYGNASSSNRMRVKFTLSGSNGISILSPDTLVVGTWTHVAVVMDGVSGSSTARLYINGSEVATDSYSGLDIFTDTSASGLLSMGNNGNLNRGPNISMDDVRFYNRALPSEEINDSMYIEADSGDAGLIGYWRLNHPTDLLNQTVYDYSYLGNHGTVGTGSGVDSYDPESVNGPVKYRINDIFHYQEKIFFATSNPETQIMIYDKYDQGGVLWNSFNLGLPNNNRDTKALFIDGNKGYAIQDSYIIAFDPDNHSAITGTATNLNPGSTGISSPTSINGSGNKIYATGLDPLRNLMILNVPVNNESPFTIESVQNILLNTYL